ncbi:helix-turn-helix transcriptional regulator (plasmid) [Candidatus Williamhamiltonella defendens]|nr:helix-turn-helix transcriptional regulator [Candidatus Hamiltonella defensa]
MRERKMRKLRDADFAFYAEIFPCLSWKEVKVLSLYCNGWNRNKVALYLNISVSTVKSHLSNAMEKINVESNSELKPMFFFIVNGHHRTIENKSGSCCCCHCRRFHCCQ